MNKVKIACARRHSQWKCRTSNLSNICQRTEKCKQKLIWALN